MAIITISRRKGSLGDEIAKAVSEKLQYDLVDKKSISDVFADLGFSESDFEKFDGKKPTIWQSLSNQKKRFIHFLRAAVYDFARKNNVVILGRGGQALLKDIHGTLHVRIVAPFEIRVQRVMDAQDCDERNAEEIVIRSDRDSSGYIRSFFDVDWNNSNMYDLIINTRTMTVKTAATLIGRAVSEKEFKHSPAEVEHNLEDMALLEKVNGVIVGASDITVTHVDVEQGVVAISGLARSEESIKACNTTISDIRGVKEVQSKLEVVTLASRYPTAHID